MLKVFGKNPSGKRLERILRSPNYRDGAFQNVEPTQVLMEDASYIKMTREFFTKPASTKPAARLPFPKAVLPAPGDTPVVTWFGHSSYLISTKRLALLVDPVLSGHASPFSAFGKSFPGSDTITPADLPAIDVLVLTHDHYDHLDYQTIVQLKDRVKHIVTTLGVGAHLERWGVAPEKITELDWWESTKPVDGVTLTATPARHFSGRLFKRAQTLWASFVLDLGSHRIFIGGDSGYDGQFKVIGEKFGPFDLALLECGQYGAKWPLIHMLPEETVKAAQDLRAAVMQPVHWGKFALSSHDWDEPVKRTVAEAEKIGQRVVTPGIGESYELGKETTGRWWESRTPVN